MMLKVEVGFGYILASFSLRYLCLLSRFLRHVLMLISFCTVFSLYYYLGTYAHRAQLSITCRLGARAQT